MIDFDSDTFSKNSELNLHLAYAILCSLKKDLNREVIIDCGLNRKVFKARDILALGLCLRDFFVKNFLEERVAVVLPPGILGLLVNFGLFLSNKRPVNLNFTLSEASVLLYQKQAGFKVMVSTATMCEKLSQFPWKNQFWDVANYLKKVPQWRMAYYYGCAYAPLSWLMKILQIPMLGGNKEALLLFTSGSSAEAKAVILTHKNLLANALQIHECGVLPKGERLMGCLPLFHTFGLTVTLIYPLLYPISVITVFSPLDVRKISQVIKEEKITIHLGTPTFFKPYIKLIDSDDLFSLKAVVAGAEKTPNGLDEEWEKKFNSIYLEGYGLTETSPVVSVNLPDKTDVIRRKKGSVGRLFVGMAARIVCPDTYKILPIGEVGLLELKGANIFPGYLNDEVTTKAMFDDGWFKTHDLGRLDKDGFLYIEGRLARFSKIGGEMISHHRIEMLLNEKFLIHDEGHHFVVIGIDDHQKGERLVLLTTQSMNVDLLRDELKFDLPNLWIPRYIVQVSSIPILPSGKLDLKTCRQMAKSFLNQS